MQYYEVVQTWETRTVLDRIERCIFIPMRLLNFRDEQILRRYAGVLAGAALDRETRDLLLQLRHTVVLEFPFDRFATAALDQVRAQAGTAIARGRRQHGRRRDAGAGPRRRGREAAAPAAAADAASRRSGPSLGSDAAAAVHSRQVENYDRAGYRWFELDREAVVRGIAWDAGEISAATLQFADGTTTVLTGPDDRTPAQSSQATLGAGVTLDQLRVLAGVARRRPGDEPLGPLTRPARRSGWTCAARTTWVDASFVASRSEAADVTLLQAHAPVDVVDVASRLMAEQLHYSQAVWLNADRQSLIMQLAPYECTVDGTPLRVVEWMDPAPVTVAGNYLAFPFTYEGDDAWVAWKKREIAAAVPQVSLVPLPTGGVFGEGVLGEFNSAEKLDVTRFWKWQESPIPNLAPEIAPVQQGRQTRIGAPTVGAAADAVLSLQDPLALPALGNSDALLKTLMVSNLFNDMSGARHHQGAAQGQPRGVPRRRPRRREAGERHAQGDHRRLRQARQGGRRTAGRTSPRRAKGLGSLFNLAGNGGGGAAGGRRTPPGGRRRRHLRRRRPGWATSWAGAARTPSRAWGARSARCSRRSGRPRPRCSPDRPAGISHEAPEEGAMAFQTFVKSQFGELRSSRSGEPAVGAARGQRRGGDGPRVPSASRRSSTCRCRACSTTPRGSWRPATTRGRCMRRFGRAPSSLVDDGAATTPTTDLPYADIAVLAGVDAATSQTLQQQLGVRRSATSPTGRRSWRRRRS